jgi:hypothetical protein
MRKLVLTAALAALLAVARPGSAGAQTVIQYTVPPAGPVYTYGYAYPSYGYVSGYRAYSTYSYPVYGYPIQAYPAYAYPTYPAYAYPAFGGLSVNFGYSSRGHWGGYHGGWGGHSGGYHGGGGGRHR